MVTLSLVKHIGHITLTHSMNVYKRKIPASAIFSTKFASSIPSPASASARRIPQRKKLLRTSFEVMLKISIAAKSITCYDIFPQLTKRLLFTIIMSKEYPNDGVSEEVHKVNKTSTLV